MIETKYKTIEDKTTSKAATYSVTQLPAFRGLKMLARLTRTVGPALAKLANAEQGGEIDLSSLGDAVGALCEKLTDAEIDGITRELLFSSTVDEQPLLAQFDSHFAGKPELALQVLAFAVEVNFGGFFDAARGALAARKTPDKKAVPAASGSTSPRS
jgi:hypothetical protein